MTKKNMKQKLIEPMPGNVFRFTLGGGRFGACRVLRAMNKKEAKEFGDECLLVATCAWIGSDDDDLSEDNLRPILRLTHHTWSNILATIWIPKNTIIPKSFMKINNVQPNKNDLHIECNSFGSWESAPLQVFLQWRWENDRSALEAEEKVEKAKTEASQRKSKIERESYLNAITLEELLTKKRFQEWKGFVSSKLIKKCNEVFKETITKLINVRKSTKQEKIEILKMCIDKFNELDKESQFIMTEEREDICSEFEEITYAAGLQNIDNLADEWRDW